MNKTCVKWLLADIYGWFYLTKKGPHLLNSSVCDGFDELTCHAVKDFDLPLLWKDNSKDPVLTLTWIQGNEYNVLIYSVFFALKHSSGDLFPIYLPNFSYLKSSTFLPCAACINCRYVSMVRLDIHFPSPTHTYPERNFRLLKSISWWPLNSLSSHFSSSVFLVTTVASLASRPPLHVENVFLFPVQKMITLMFHKHYALPSFKRL